jgi:hypothetical protein
VDRDTNAAPQCVAYDCHPLVELCLGWRIGVLDRQMQCLGLEIEQEQRGIGSLVQVDQQPDLPLTELGCSAGRD